MEYASRKQLAASAIDAGAVLENMDDAFCAFDRDGCLVQVNSKTAALVGCRREELLDRDRQGALPGMLGPALRDALQQTLRDGRRRHIETTLPVSDLAVAATIVAVPTGLHIFLRDLTALRRLQDAVRERDEILNLAEQTAGIGVWDIDLATGMVRGTAQFFRIMGLDPASGEVPVEVTRQLRHPEDRERVAATYQQAVDGGAEFVQVEYRICRPDGATRWIFGRGRLSRDAAGRVLHHSGVDVDITDRRTSELALRESEERFRRVFEQSPLGKATADGAFRFREVNPALCRMLDRTPEELVGSSFLDLVHPDDRARCQEKARTLVEGGVAQIQLEERFVRKSGVPFWVSVNVGPIRDVQGNILYSLGIIEDIDDRKRITEALTTSEQRLRELNEQLEHQAERRARQLAASRAQLQAFFNHSPDWMTLIRATADGRFVYADLNPACEEAYGLGRDQVIGRTPDEVLGAEGARVPLQHLRECLRTGVPQRYVIQRTMGDRTRTIDVMFILVPDPAEDGNRFIITTARDITERERLEAQLRQAQKMEAIGQLTGGVAHDFNNLLAVVMGNAELAKRRPTGNLAMFMDNILRAGERGVALTRQLLSVSRRNAGERQVLDLAVEMPRIAEMLRTSLRGNIELAITVAPDLWLIEVDPDEFEIALLNVAVNARDAMPEGGRFEIDVRNGVPGRSPGLEDDHIVVALRDTGTGIPPDVIGKVFDPFFTTKDPGVGTGLGLSQVYGFAQQSAGTVVLDSAPGRGTTVMLCLPRTSRPLAGATSGVADAIAASTGGRILLVEDNPDVASVTAQMLRAMGFEVDVEDRARKALDRLADAGEAVDLLLTDVVMPDGMNGLELARAVRARLPALPIILMSGYNDAVPARGAEFRMLRKPVPGAELRDAICDALAGQPAVRPPA